MTIISQSPVMESIPFMVAIGAIIFIIAIGFGIYLSIILQTLYALCLCIGLGAAVMFVFCFPQRSTGRMMYKVLLDQSVTYEEISEEYDIVGGDFPYLYLEKKSDE